MTNAKGSSKDHVMVEQEIQELKIEQAKLEIKKQKQQIEMARSRVRRLVTYASIFGYIILASFVVVWLMCAGRYEIAIGVLGGIAGLAGSISGFWFGSRRPKSSEAPENKPQND